MPKASDNGGAKVAGQGRYSHPHRPSASRSGMVSPVGRRKHLDNITFPPLGGNVATPKASDIGVRKSPAKGATRTPIDPPLRDWGRFPP